MTAALSAVPSEGEVDQLLTVSGSGLDPSTVYTLVVNHASGEVTTVAVTSDGSGSFAYPFVPQSPGSRTFTLLAAPAVLATLTVEAAT